MEAVPTAESLHDYGVALLLLGDLDAAIAALEEATQRNTGLAAAWSDLGAAYLARARSVNRDADLPRALDAIGRASRLGPKTWEVHFNLGLALEGLQLTEQAIEAFEQLSAGEPSSEWDQEARAHIARLRTQTGLQQSDVATRLGQVVLGELAESDTASIVAADPREAREAFENDLLPTVAASAMARGFDDPSFRRLQTIADALTASSGDNLPTLGLAALRPARTVQSTIEGLRLLGDGKQAFAADDLARAEASLGRSRELLAATGHPYRVWADFYHAQVLFYLGRVDHASRLLSGVRQIAHAGKHRVVWARAGYLSGLIEMRQSRYTAAAATQKEAADTFEAAGEGSLAAAARSELAEALDYLAEPDAAWKARIWTLRYALARPAHRLRHVALAGASRAAARDGLLFAALQFQEATLRNARQWQRVPAEVESHLRRAEIAERLGRPRESLEALSQVQVLFEMPRNRPALRGWESQLHQLRASALLAFDPVAALSSTLAARMAADRQQSRLNQAYMELLEARAARRVGFSVDARRHLDAAMELLEAEAAFISPEFERVSTSDRVWQVFTEAAGFAAMDVGDPEWTLEIVERGRSLLGLPRTGSTRALRGALAEALPPDAVLLYYEPLPDRLLVWRVARDAFAFWTVAIRRDEISTLVSQLRIQTSNPSSGGRYRELAQRLHRVLFGEPATALRRNEQVAIVADPLLAAVPFAALIDPDSGRHLVEDHPVVIVPSATVYLQATSTLRALEPARGAALLVGNPATVSAVTLPGADDEIRALQRIYPDAVALRGGAATASTLTLNLKGAEVLHFAGHARANARYPRLSYLQLAGDAEDAGSVLSAATLSTLEMKNLRLAVLAACESAGGSTEPGSPAFGLAKAFLVAGAPSVVGSLWPIDDRATSQLVVHMHDEYVRGGPASAALRAAQLAFLAAAEPARKHPYFWASLQTYGGLSHPLR